MEAKTMQTTDKDEDNDYFYYFMISGSFLLLSSPYILTSVRKDSDAIYIPQVCITLPL